MPVKPWIIRNATQNGQSCPQGRRNLSKSIQPTFVDIEDCLNMNIFAPSQSIKYAVIVYIHGGSFSSGSNFQYQSSYLLERDIVLVVPNYRLGALGKQ